MKLKTGYDEPRARVEMIPLMDVVFLLLVFFVYAMFNMSVHRGLKVALPRASGTLMVGEQTVVTLCADGRLLLDNHAGALPEIVRGAVARWREARLPVLIRADREAPLGAGIELLAALRGEGVERVSFQVRTEETPESVRP